MKGDSLFAFVAGAAAGLTLGLLFAPERGEETRRKLRETAGDAADSAKARARLARMELNDLRAELQDKAEDLKEDVRMRILERLEKLESAMDAIRDKYGKDAIAFGHREKMGWDD